MLNAIHAAEVQYRHDSARLDREHLLLARIAERTAAPTPTSRHRFTAPHAMAERATPGLAAVTAARGTVRAAWPRPISRQGRLAGAPALAGAELACC
ncbi:hypothetical protein ACLQ2Q_08020 [Microbacterium sp. DT81.1]|uniref:hypothetical protein n=1 Tax=Microbacterium sp. DT81.1 TaxID=3393413 RepID=UPI003CF48132